MRNTDAKEVKVSDASELKEQLQRHKVPHGVTRCVNVVGYIGDAAPFVNEWLFVFENERNAPSIGGGDGLSAKYQFNDCALVDRSSSIAHLTAQASLERRRVFATRHASRLFEHSRSRSLLCA